MIHLPDITTSMTSMLAKTDALQRWNAMRNTSSSSAGVNQTWQWIIVIVMFVLLIAFIVIPILAYFRKRFVVLLGVLRTELARVPSMTNIAGLTDSDVDMITRMVRQSGFLRPGMEFTLLHAFNIGTANYLGSDEYTELPGEQRLDVVERIEGLEKKLGTTRLDNEEQTMTTRDILVGAQIMVSHAGQEDNFDMLVQANTDEGLRVQPPIPLESPPDSSWILRYFDGVKVWGFTTSVAAKDGDCLILEHTDEMEMVNFRRFARVPVKHSAQISRFVFHSLAETQSSLEFVHADVVEIGGPGIMLYTTLDVSVGDRILILLNFGKNEIIRAVGKIRRRNESERVANRNCYGVELIGLKPSQVAELMHATNSTAIRLHKEEQKEDAKEPEPVYTA
jgi:hypothetical protein